MSWQLFVGLAIFLYSINALLHRVLMRDTKSDAYAQAVIFNGLTGICTLTLLLFQRTIPFVFPTVQQLPILLTVVGCVTIATICTFKGLKVLEASEHTILLTSSKIWLVIGSLFILHEHITVFKFAGAMIILLGVFITEWRNKKFTFTSGVAYVLIAAFLYATGEVLSFFILRDFNALIFMVYTSFLCFVTLVAINPRVIPKLSFYVHPKFGLTIITVSLFDTLATLFVFLAYQTGRNALQIGPLMATQTIVTVLLALIILKETDHLPQKLFGTITVVVGSMLLVL